MIDIVFKYFQWVVPAVSTDEDLKHVAAFRSKGRMPVSMHIFFQIYGQNLIQFVANKKRSIYWVSK